MYDFYEETFLTMCQLKRENDVWWLENGEIRRRDDEAEEVHNEAPAENMENEEVNEEEDDQHDFDWEAVNEEAEIQGESGLAERFYEAQDEVQESAYVIEEQRDTTAAEVDPSVPVGSIPDADFQRIQAEFERARADRIQPDLDRAQAENARLLAMLHQAQSQPKP
ncbi:hypothetical protein Dimus_001709 [Dionaea muscipula]